jgi:D-alanyl-D-alanine dipeptidase
MTGLKKQIHMIIFIIMICILFSFSGCADTVNDPEASETVPVVTVSNTPVVTPIVSDTQPEVFDDDLVKVVDYIPDIYVGLRYATEDNFTGKVIYDFTDAYLRYGTVKKLAAAQAALAEAGFCLKIWDAYRPVSAQFTLWEIYPDPAFVADPMTGYSNHSRGNTVDVTLVMLDESDIEMPTGFDDFSPLADRDYTDISQTAKENAMILQDAMEKNGFICYFNEWWHYSDSVAYDVVID